MYCPEQNYLRNSEAWNNEVGVAQSLLFRPNVSLTNIIAPRLHGVSSPMVSALVHLLARYSLLVINMT